MRGKRSQVGDTRVAPNGYHYTRTKEGWELTGRLIAAQKMGRPLMKGERVRYLDGDPNNLTEENIEVFMAKQKSTSSRLARLYAKRDEIQAEIDMLEMES